MLYTRHDEVPTLSTRPARVEAAYYNHVQVALKRIDSQIRLRIPKLKHLDLILQEGAWIVVDRVLNDIPIAAWCEFNSKHRNNLHQPVPCTIRLYHYAATMILRRTLESMDEIINDQLKEKSRGSVVQLSDRL